MVAYHLESHALAQTLCVTSQWLPAWIHVVFEGDSADVVREDRTLKASVARLRAASAWLLFNCWPWLEATQSLSITADYFGSDIETACSSFSDENDDGEGAVPEALVASATSTGRASSPQFAQETSCDIFLVQHVRWPRVTFPASGSYWRLRKRFAGPRFYF